MNRNPFVIAWVTFVLILSLMSSATVALAKEYSSQSQIGRVIPDLLIEPSGSNYGNIRMHGTYISPEIGNAENNSLQGKTIPWISALSIDSGRNVWNNAEGELWTDKLEYKIYLPLGMRNSQQSSSWTEFTSPITETLNAVDLSSSTDGWSVGTGGSILHWNGSTWSNISSPTSADLNGIDMLDTATGWAVGSGGTIIKWNGAVWSSENGPVSIDLNDIKVLAANNAWAAGADGKLLHWDGIAWTSISSLTTYDLYALDFASSTDGWAVGGEWNTGIGWYEAAYLHWDGVSWSNYTPAPVLDVLYDVDLVSSTNGIAVGINNAKSYWDGTSWSVGYSDPLMTSYFGVDFLTADDGWAVGWMYQESNIQHWDGTGWSRVTSPVTTALNDVFMLNAENGWSVGEAGKILRYGP